MRMRSWRRSVKLLIRAFSSTRSSDRRNATHGLGHESFGDILAAAWLGQLPPVQLLLGITNKGTEFAENRPTAFQPLRRRVARLMCVRCATSTSVRNCVLILIEPSFCFPLLPSIRFSFCMTAQTSLRNPCSNRVRQPTFLQNALHGYVFEPDTSEAPPLLCGVHLHLRHPFPCLFRISTLNSDAYR